MPHVTVDYSANMEDRMDMAAFCDALRRTAIDTGVLPMPGIRVRAFCANHASIADGAADHGYVDISVRLRGGRDLATRKAATQTLFETAKTFLAPVFARHSVALSFEMRDIDPDLSPKYGTIRDHLVSGDPE